MLVCYDVLYKNKNGVLISFYSKEKEVKALKVVQVDIDWWSVFSSRFKSNLLCFKRVSATFPGIFTKRILLNPHHNPLSI